MPIHTSVMLRAFVLTYVCMLCPVVPACSAAPQKPEPGSDIKLERVPPMTPQQSLASIEVAPGFRMELVASEPNVMSPVAMAFDEYNRLYVVEMRDYSEKDKEFLGRIRLLTDEDGDGRYETSKVFVDHLSWPTAVTCYDGGIFVGDPPNIRYCKDTNGDGEADVNNVIYTGFSRKNVQGMMNSLQWGLDHRIYGTSSTTGGKVRRVVPGSPDPAQESKPIDLHNRDFAINPKTLEMSTLTGGGQHGMSFNRWGDRFVCSNSDHLQAIVFEERYVARNPYQSVVSARRSIASDGPQAEVYRISPVEAWRVARTMLRVTGQVKGMIEGGGRAAGYFTGATGVTIYEGGQWPEKDGMIALTADVGSNLIHRKHLVRDGVTYRGDRIDKNTEFIRARDIWFRPVQMAIGPDGALYIMDMYREVIEHPESLPKVLKRQLDLSSGQNMGRIYRVVPAGNHYSRPKPLGKAGPAELVDALDDANQWRRLTALRLIYERQQPETADLLRAKFDNCKRPEGRIAVLYALDSLGALGAADLMKALGGHPQVCRHAMRLSEPMLDKSPDLLKQVLSLVTNDDPVVQFQLAFTLGESRGPAATQALADILIRSSKNRDIMDAALTSIVDRAGNILKSLLAHKWSGSHDAEPILTAIVGQIVRQHREGDLNILVEILRTSGGKGRSASTAVLLKALSHLPADVLGGNSPQLVKLRELRSTAATSLVREARHVLESSSATSEERVDAIEDLALDKFDNQRELLEQLLSPQESTAVHSAVLSTCGQFTSPAVADLILAHWEQLSPTERSQAGDVLLRRGPWALAFVQHLEKSGGALTMLDPAHIARLQNYPSPNVRNMARKLRGQSVTKDRQKVFQEYKDGGALAGGDPAQGKLIFEKNCATCHEVGGIGHQVGPNLASMVSRGTESVLFNVLAPNAEIDPRFIEYVITTNGQVLNGVIAGETPTAVTLRGPDNKTTTILLVDVEDRHSTGKSLMPEGFEKVIDKKSMASLLSFLQQAAAAPGVAK
jgi:putative membrane-bound dehydrogenase-like protein